MDFGLHNAVAIGLNQQACTSMLGSLRIASALLASEPAWNQVLCVTADRFPDGARYEQAYNLISDGAAACLVTTDVGGAPTAVEGGRCATDRHLWATGDGGGGQEWPERPEWPERLVREMLKKADMSASGLTHVVTQNTHQKFAPEKTARPRDVADFVFRQDDDLRGDRRRLQPHAVPRRPAPPGRRIHQPQPSRRGDATLSSDANSSPDCGEPSPGTPARSTASAHTSPSSSCRAGANTTILTFIDAPEF